MKTRNIYFFLFLIGLFVNGYGQSSNYTSDHDIHHLVDRYTILYGQSSTFHTSLRGYSRQDVSSTLFDMLRNNHSHSNKEQKDIQYVLNDNTDWITHFQDDDNEVLANLERKYIDSTKTFYTLEEADSNNKDPNNKEIEVQTRKPFLGIFYKTPANLWELETENVYIKANPILNIKVGSSSNDDNIIFQNTRGLEVRGAIDNKIYFHTSLYENQQRFNDYIERRISDTGSIPGNGFYKIYESTVSDRISGWDFLNAEAYVGFNISKSVGIELGHGNHFIGDGYNSLLLDDYGQNYFYLKFNTKIWKFHYQNIFAELSAFGSRDNGGNGLLPKKYMATHYLNYNVTKNLSIGLFETVVFSRVNDFEFQYLNPVIIYRTVEGFLDSPDNILIGLNANYRLFKTLKLYGQVIFDEFKSDQFTSSDGWWASKYGIQMGAKYINVAGIDHLDAQVELNTVRPFTYSHRDSIVGLDDRALASYSHYNQPLAHPLGSNFRELVFKVRYVPLDRLTLNARFISSFYGTDIEGQNWGGDILRSHHTRFMDFGNKTGQGDRTTVTLAGLDISYALYHNMYIDLHMLYRKQDSESGTNDYNTQYFGLGIRMNVANQKLDY